METPRILGFARKFACQCRPALSCEVKEVSACDTLQVFVIRLLKSFQKQVNISSIHPKDSCALHLEFFTVPSM